MSITMSPALVGQVVSELTRLPEEDLSLVIEFVEFLKQCRAATPTQRLSPAEMRAEAQRRATLLRDVPREDIVARFRELTEEIRREAIAKGTAVEEDWRGD